MPAGGNCLIAPMHLSFENIFFRYIIGICVVVLLFIAGLYAYMGTFSRYRADDYCEAVRIQRSSPLGAVFERYFAENWPRATMRYSNLFFVGLSEALGTYGMPSTIASMVLLWYVGNVWGIHELRKWLGINWSFGADLFWGLTFGFFTLKQAPNLFQTVYWRSAMMTHFAPLVFGWFLFAFLIRLARRPERQSVSLPIYFLIFIATFIIAGFSEPPTTTMLTALPLLMLVISLSERSAAKRKYLSLLGTVFVGVCAGLLAMLLSPASTNATQEETRSIIQVLLDSFFYSYLFLIDSLKTQPLPFLLCVLISLMFVWLYRQVRPFEFSSEQKRIIRISMLALPFLVWFLIAAGFSPSVYGQSFPVERMRFLARAMMIAAFMFEGALFGLLLGRIGFRANAMLAQSIVAVAFAVIAIGYPLRTGLSLLQDDLPDYRNHAVRWDQRDAFIRQQVVAGARELDVIQLDTIDGVQEYKDKDYFWVNRCAAEYYGLDSLRAP